LEGKHRFGSAAIHETAFQCLLWFVGPDLVEDGFLAAARDILQLFRRFGTNEDFGIFKGVVQPAGDVAYTSLLTDLLHHHFPKTGDFLLHWVHQLPDPKSGKMDIALYVSATIGSPMVPVAIVEVGFKGGNRRWQAGAYAVNVFGQVKDRNRSLLSLELMIDRVSVAHTMALRCYAAAREEEERNRIKFLWASTILDCDVDEASLGNVLKSLVSVAPKSLEGAPNFLRMGTNVCIDRANGEVVKFFDYRFREVLADQRRSTKLSLERLGAKKIIESDNLEVISYPFLKGKHYATKVGQFVDVANEMKELHDKEVCHGDIRAFNILFREGEKSCLIDFDFAGESGRKRYPEGYSNDISDAKRHTKASGGKKLYKEHDCFSLASIMRLHSCEEEDSWWEEVANSVEKGKIDKAIEEMQGRMSVALNPKKLIIIIIKKKLKNF
jgi:hypothetical protein